jgi:hypothetical protein
MFDGGNLGVRLRQLHTMFKQSNYDSLAASGAIAIARRQGARSFELRAALSLAKLYQSTGRAVEAHAVVASALEGFSPTPEMPETAEAQALLSQLT